MAKRIILRKTITNLPLSKSCNTQSINLPPIPGFIKRYRNCENLRYVTYPSPCCSYKDEWVQSYEEKLLDMYRITRLMIESRYPNCKIDWDNPKYYRAFISLIYHCSSKHISMYL